MRVREGTGRQLTSATSAGAAGLAGYVTIYLTAWLLSRFSESGATFGFLVQLILSLGVVLAVVIGAALPACALEVEWPLAIGGAFSAHTTMVFLALAIEFYVGTGDPYGLALAAGFGLFMLFGVAPRLEVSRRRMEVLGILVAVTGVLGWLSPGPDLVAPAIAWVGLPVLIATWGTEP